MPRIALVGVGVCLLASCGGGTEPNSGGSGRELVGLWDATLSEINAISGSTGEPVQCTAEGVMSISAEGTGEARQLFTIIPLTATVRCGRGAAEPWRERSNWLGVRQAADSIVFLTGRLESFIVARFGGSARLSGEVAGGYDPGARFSAARRGGSVDPNGAPYSLEPELWTSDVEVATVSAQPSGSMMRTTMKSPTLG